ncbi:MAG: protoglobin domain-containing protein [Acidobacteriota bacterium]
MTELIGTETIHNSVAQMLSIYDLSSDDLDQIRTLGEVVSPRIDECIETFYGWLQTQPEYEIFFSSPEQLERVKGMQARYWSDFFRADIDDAYLEKRRSLGETHARIGLPLSVYFSAMNYFLKVFSQEIPAAQDNRDQPRTAAALTKLVHLDTALVVESFSLLTNRKIADQGRALTAMSTPVTAIWKGVLLLPIVGIIDSKRSQDIMESMLSAISESQSRIIILDISGVAVVDTAVANHLIRIGRATRLMGCECVISGISPAIARTIVELGIDVGEIRTTSTLRDSIEYAFSKLGLEIRQSSKTSRS